MVRKHLEIGPLAQMNDLLCCDKFDIMDRVEEINVPALVVCGDEDIMTPVKYSDYLAERMPSAERVLISGGTHHMFLEEPDLFNKAVDNFIKSLK